MNVTAQFVLKHCRQLKIQWHSAENTQTIHILCTSVNQSLCTVTCRL